jgi:hypothetical protein
MFRAGSSAEFRSYVFLLDADGVHALEHAVYVALARGEARLLERAGQASRLADWYVRLEAGTPVSVVNEWYGWVTFDETGRLLTHDGPALSNNHTRAAEQDNIDTAALPGPAELEAMHTRVFGAAPQRQ